MPEPEWRFQTLRKGDINTDPVQDEFFTPEGLAEALVREAVQNSLDAALSTQQLVSVRIKVSSQAISPKKAKKYFIGLAPHLSAIPNQEFANTLSEFRYLVIEDFGTRGLRGDPKQHMDSSEGVKNDFYYFWRNVGRSKKEETDRGRWGLGKTVFPASSEINSFFGLTIRSDDKRELLMGQAMLKTHSIDSTRFHPYGFFADHAQDTFQNPIEDSKLINEFKEDFGLTRKDETGLSIVIPFYRSDEIHADNLVRAAILHYFHPILNGKLKITVSNGMEGKTIERSNIRSLARDCDWSDLGREAADFEKLFDLVEWSSSVTKDTRINLSLDLSGAPEWREDLFTPADLERARQAFEADQPLAIRAHLIVKLKNQGVADRKGLSSFDIFLKRDSNGSKTQEYYVRQGITVSKISGLTTKGILGLVVIEDSQLATLLGDSENPAHTDWLERSPKLKIRYSHGASCVRFVKASLKRVVGFLLRPPSALETDLLSSFFSLPVNRVPGTIDPRVPAPPTEKHQSQFEIERLEGGFVLRRSKAPNPQPIKLRIETAYALRRGNPFKRYEPLDFKLEDLDVTATGPEVELTRCAGNLIEVSSGTGDFSISVKGFDRRRDLRIKATTAGEGGAS